MYATNLYVSGKRKQINILGICPMYQSSIIICRRRSIFSFAARSSVLQKLKQHNLICDEPTSALDPVGRKEILDILRKISSTTTVLFSTHILSDVERICDHVAFLNGGKIEVCGTIAEIKTLHGHDSLLLEFPTDKEMRVFKEQEGVKPLLCNSEENNREMILHSRNMEKVQQSLFRVFAETGICPIKMEIMEPSLESLFLEVVK